MSYFFGSHIKGPYIPHTGRIFLRRKRCHISTRLRNSQLSRCGIYFGYVLQCEIEGLPSNYCIKKILFYKGTYCTVKGVKKNRSFPAVHIKTVKTRIFHVVIR